MTVTYAFSATEKDKLINIIAPQPITVANGTAYGGMNLPATVTIETEGNTVTTASVTWDTSAPASGSYDPTVLTEQTVTLNGTVDCPADLDANGVSLTTTLTITISAAGIVGAPTANPTAGTYTGNQSVALTSSTEGATIYYTTDGSEPTITGGVPSGTTAEYTASIAVTGTKGQSVQTKIKAIAVKSGMQDSSVETFTYTIQIPVPKYDVTVTNGSGTGQYEPGSPATPNTTYQIIDGAKSSWTLGSREGLTIRGNGDFDKFTGVKVDGRLLDQSNYTAKEGSTIITLKASYLNALAAGDHTVEILWTDGSAGTTVTINASTSKDSALSGGTNTKDDVPDTGDRTPMVWLLIPAGLSGMGLILTARKGRKSLKASGK